MKVKVIRVVSTPKCTSHEEPSDVIKLQQVVEDLTEELGRYVDDVAAAKKQIDDLIAERDAARLQLSATRQALEQAEGTKNVLLEECRKLNDRLDAALKANISKDERSNADAKNLGDKIVAYLIF